LSTVTPKEETPDVDAKFDPFGDLFSRTPDALGADDLADLDGLPASELFMSQWPSSSFGLDIYQLIDADLMADYTPFQTPSSTTSISSSSSSGASTSALVSGASCSSSASMLTSSEEQPSPSLSSSSSVIEFGEYDTPEVSEMLGCDDWIKTELDSDICLA
jgi:hypothetical protein